LRYSQGFIPTLKEEPREAEISSHALTVRAGLIRKIASGIYAFLPAGKRVIQKIENIIREEMDRTGALELFLPVLQPSDLWEKSGRWGEYGPELFRLKDRNGRSFCLGPTHEEIMTYLAYLDIKSYRDLPLNLYQIQVKFRDEIRPRYGLLRAREFIMKDAYSFCENDSDLDEIYNKMHSAYTRIMERMGLKYKTVEADTGIIGGKSSHEFMVLAGDGEETIIYCPECGYSANIEMAGFRPLMEKEETFKNAGEIEKVSTPGITDIDRLADFLKIEKKYTVKTILLTDEKEKIYAFILMGDRQLNISKAEKFLGKELRLYENSDERYPIGYLGPVGLDPEIEIYADRMLKGVKGVITGANKKDFHLRNVNIQRDVNIKAYGDFSYPVEGDICERCGSKLKIDKGIEIGHIFKLGKKYSEKMEARFLGRDGRLKPFVMGCYGMGITRILSAVIEQMHDDKGIIWPTAIAPYTVNLLITSLKEEQLVGAGEEIYEKLLDSGIEVLYDDREVSAGIKFKDSDLLGLPLKIVLGRKYLDEGLIEVQLRKNGKQFEINPKDIVKFVKDFISSDIKK
jgi:prolyl-tRNA synthetase